MATTKITSPDLFNLESLNTALKLPSGTTAERPTSPSTGEWRYNTTTNLVEFWDGGAWRDLQSEDIPPIPSENFNTVLYTGDGGAARQVTGVGFKPDLVWVKKTNSADDNVWFDTTRGVQKELISNSTAAEATKTEAISSFDADGYTTGPNGAINANGSTYVAWCWKANGGTTSSNTDGTITSTVQANTKAAFSVVSYTGNAVSGATIGHGLGVEPDIVIVKNLNLSTQSWNTYVKNVTTTNAQFLTLNTADANGNTANPRFIPGNFSSSVFSVGNDNSTNGASGVDTYIAYCFASVAGYSKISSYTGNGSASAGPIINTGFEPAYVMIKRTDSIDDWIVVDNKRNTTNSRYNYLMPNSNAVENGSASGAVNPLVNFLTNGFQIAATWGAVNNNGSLYVYMAFASDGSTAPTLPDSFANKLYTGNGGTQAITGLGFSPSFVWLKRRDGTGNHYLNDTIRGTKSQISSNLTAAETTYSSNITSYDTDGFTLGTSTDNNGSGQTFVAWNWKGNTVPTINTDGTNQSVVSANQAAGVSIVQGTASGGLNTVNSFGHGLGVKPDLIIIKSTSSTDNWYVYNSISGAGKSLYLNDSAAEFSTTNVWANTEPTASVFSIKDGQTVSVGATFISYCFTSISGFSKIGTYTGNGSSTGPTITTGFQPSWIMIKRTQNAASWAIVDAARGGNQELYANLNDADNTFTAISFLSDGFQIVNTANGYNSNGETYIFMAFKENPTPMPLAGNMSFLVVAGGGGGGFGSGGGGAGAGGLRTSYGGSSGGGSAAESDITLAAGTYTITIGAGGTGGIDTGNVLPTAGANSTVSTITSIGGGYGGSEASGSVYGPSVGGSGAGAIYNNTYPGSAGTANQGSAGGNGYGSSPVFGGGGGGGASAAGATASGSGGGLGGDGLEVSITGTATYYAGGGGGDTQGVNTTRAGGSGGGGTGGRYMAANDITTATGGTANTGGGGGGGTNENDTDNGLGGPGGSGVVILRLATSEYSGTTTGSPTVTTDGTYTILTYTGSGTYVHS